MGVGQQDSSRNGQQEIGGEDWDSLRGDVNDMAGAAVERGRVIAVPGWGYKLICLAARLLPSALLLWLMGRNSRKFRRVD